MKSLSSICQKVFQYSPKTPKNSKSEMKPEKFAKKKMERYFSKKGKKSGDFSEKLYDKLKCVKEKLGAQLHFEVNAKNIDLTYDWKTQVLFFLKKREKKNPDE